MASWGLGGVPRLREAYLHGDTGLEDCSLALTAEVWRRGLETGKCLWANGWAHMDPAALITLHGEGCGH